MKEKQRKKRKKLISDPRFEGVHTDPRFRDAPKNETKVAVDSRFKHMFDDNTFFSSSAPIDKRGRPVENNLTFKSDFLHHYYNVEEEEGLMEENDKGVENESHSSTDEEEDTYTDEDTDTLDMQVLLCAKLEMFYLVLANISLFGFSPGFSPAIIFLSLNKKLRYLHRPNTYLNFFINHY